MASGISALDSSARDLTLHGESINLANTVFRTTASAARDGYDACSRDHGFFTGTMVAAALEKVASRMPAWSRRLGHAQLSTLRGRPMHASPAVAQGTGHSGLSAERPKNSAPSTSTRRGGLATWWRRLDGPAPFQVKPTLQSATRSSLKRIVSYAALPHTPKVHERHSVSEATSTHAAAGVKCTTNPSRFVCAAFSTNDGPASLGTSVHLPGGSENLNPKRSEPAATLPRIALPGSAPRSTPAGAENSKLATKSCQSTFLRVDRVSKLT